MARESAVLRGTGWFNMKVLFVWTGVTSYMVDCWREFAKRKYADSRIFIVRHSSGREIEAEKLFSGLDVHMIDDGTPIDLGSWIPDTVFAVGWRSKSVRKLVGSQNLQGVPKICCFDMPWRWRLRCICARWVLARYLARFNAAFVPGESAARYAIWLGFTRIYTGLFSLDTNRFPHRCASCGFLYLGRHVPEKRIDLLVRAYTRYRELGGSWNLDIYGGEKFIQPSDVPSLYANHACLVLASSFDPWPLVILEATASGLRVISSDRCGNVDELGARKVKYADTEAMARAMLDAEHGCFQPAGRGTAEKYDCRKWVDRVVGICNAVTGNKNDD